MTAMLPSAARRSRIVRPRVRLPNAGAAAAPARRWFLQRRWLLATTALCALGLVWGAYANSFRNGFHFDDSHVIERNPFIRDLGLVGRYFTDARTFSVLPTNQTYRPLETLSLAIDYRIAGGLDPVPFHVTQMVLLTLIGAGLVLFFRKLLEGSLRPSWRDGAALFAATLFCVHTGNTQPVNYISSRSELLSALGVIAAFDMYLYLPRWRRFHLYLVPMVLGALAKPPAVLFAPLLLLWELLITRRLSMRDLLRRGAWPHLRGALRTATPAFVVGVGAFAFVEGMNPPEQTYGGSGRFEYLLTQTWMWVRYVRLFVLPTGLNPDLAMDPFSTWADPRVAAGALLLAASAVAFWRCSRTAALRPVSFGIAWFWLGIAPTSSVITLADTSADHRAFLGYVGLTGAAVTWSLVWLQGWAVRTRFERPVVLRLAAAAGITLLLAHGVGTHLRNRVWRDAETLWGDVVTKSPDNGRAWMNFGLVKMERGDYAAARELFLRAEQEWPTYSLAQVNLAIATDALGDHDAAERYFQAALALAPWRSSSHSYYARHLARHGRAPEAIRHYRRAIDLAPGEIDSRHQLMALLAAGGAQESLQHEAEATLALFPRDAIARLHRAGERPFEPLTPDFAGWLELGSGFLGDGRLQEAAIALREAVRLNDASPDALNNLGWSLLQIGFVDEAIAAFEGALRLTPGDVRVRNNLALARSHGQPASVGGVTAALHVVSGGNP